MVKNILLALFAFILIALIVIWVISGGPRQIITETRESLSGAFTLGDANDVRLPWQPDELFAPLDITEVLDIAPDGEPLLEKEEKPSAYEQLRQLEAEYDRLRGEAARQSYGPPSPYAGKIGFTQASSLGAHASNPQEEYLQLAASYSNSEPINISGWTLQSAISSANVQIPLAASPLVSYGANTVGAVLLEPGAIAHVSSAQSPVGFSFRENMCIGFLQQTSRFDPPLYEECPSPSSILPLTERNLQQYGESCFDAIQNLPSCRTPQIPQNASPTCRAFLADKFSYDGCVRDNRFRAEFQGDSWRLYLGAYRELWGNSHDAIRLLDAQGRTVSVFVY